MFLTSKAVALVSVSIIPAALLPGPAWISLLIVNLALIALVVWDVASAASPLRLEARVASPSVVSIKQDAQVTVRLHNPLHRSLTVFLHLSALPSLRRSPPRVGLNVPAREREKVTFSISPTRRGFFSVGPLTVRSLGGMGLAGRQRTLPIFHDLKVYPALPSRRQVSLRLDRARMLQSGERSSAIRGGGTAFDSLREYHSDDEFRKINWKATARAAKPITNLYREERNQNVVLLIDGGQMMAASIRGLTRFEHGIDAAVAVAELSGYVGDHVGMVAFSTSILAMVPPRSGKTQAKRIVDALFRVEPSLSAADYVGAFGMLLSRYRRRALLILLTELSEQTAMESLFKAMPALLSRHIVIIASVRDPALEVIENSVPTSSEEVFLQAAAGDSLLARELTAQRFRRMGAVVIDRNPGELAGRVADEYLRIKAFGRL